MCCESSKVNREVGHILNETISFVKFFCRRKVSVFCVCSVNKAAVIIKPCTSSVLTRVQMVQLLKWMVLMTNK